MEATQQVRSRTTVWFFGQLSGQKLLLAAALAVVFGLALGLRLYGLDWDRGYPFTPHPDERVILMKVGELSSPPLGELGKFLDPDESPWNPRWFPYGSFPLYLLKGVQLVYSAWPGAELHDLRLAGRMISALADVGTVVLVYLLGSRLFGRREGLLASALLALAVVHIQLSHFYSVDTLLAFCAVAALYFMYGVAREGRLRDSILAGAFIGLGVATKVSLAPIYIAFVMAHLLFLLNVMVVRGRLDVGPADRWWAALKGLAAGAAASLLVVLVVQPYTFLDWSRFYDDFIEQSEMVRRMRDYPYTRQYIDTTPYWYHVRQLATWGLGWPLGIVAWGGLLYASLRGMRLRSGMAYLGLGWGLPIAVLLYSTSFPAILVASVIATVALLATLPLRSAESRAATLLLSWVVPYFLITGAFQVKFIRYLIPITPLLILLGSRMVFMLWDWAAQHRPAVRPWVAAGLLFLVSATGFYALSYMAVYAEPHTAVRTSEWLNRNASKGAVILREHWEEGIPNLDAYEIRQLPLYDADEPGKLHRLYRDLAEGDYILFFSNRLYGTIPRLEERYPFSTEYYRLLFSGALGYELVDAETAYPRLAGVSIVDDTFGRPNVPRPAAIDTFRPSGLVLSLGFADESFSVYDHPMGLVFQNVDRHDAETIRQTIEDAVPEDALRGVAPGEREIGRLLSHEEAEALQLGGTWSEIVHTQSWASRFPALAWLLLIEGVALLALPVAFILFRPLPDRGYFFSKALGLLAVSLVVWLLASAHWMQFSRGSIVLALLLLGVGSAVALAANWRPLFDFVRMRWPVLLVGEAIFIAAYFSFLMVRMANPDLWHPVFGGEKPMDLAYLTAVLKSSYMPPYDPWFSGGYLNYYYWGQFIVATMTKVTGIAPSVAFNLAVPLFFALTVTGAFAIVYNLAEGTRLSRQRELPRGERSRWIAWSPVLAGVAGAAFVTLLGNLDGAMQVGHGLWRYLLGNVPFVEFNFWRSSHEIMLPGTEITEFPFFTFLYGDLHAHLMAMPFTLLALGLSLAVVFNATQGRVWQAFAAGVRPRRSWSPDELARLAALGVAVGALRAINTWDYPTYMVVAVASVFLAGYFRGGGLGIAVLVESGMKSALVFLAGYLAFLPFQLNYQAFYTSLEDTTNQTVLWHFLVIYGLFVFIIGSFFVGESNDWLLRWWRAIERRMRALASVSSRGHDDPIPARDRRRVGVMRVSAMVLVAAIVGYAVSVSISGWLGSTIPFLIVMSALVVVGALRFLLSFRDDAPQLAFVAVIIGVSLALAIGVDIYRVEGDVDRMNSVFKVYLQVWVMLGLASAYLLWRIGFTGLRRRHPLGIGGGLWSVALAALIIGAAIFPILGTQAKLKYRFDLLPLTLDGMAYMRDAVYGDRNGEIQLSSDYEGIKWLQNEVQGSPIVLEGVTPIYRWGGRISVYTGLPTVLGWQWHQEQQRWGYRWAVAERSDDVDRIYSTTDASEALSLLRKYGVEYVYVGQLEGLYYPIEGLKKFDGELSGYLEQVYQNGHVRIYRLREG